MHERSLVSVKVEPRSTSRLRWPEPMYLRVGYVFESDFFFINRSYLILTRIQHKVVLLVLRTEFTAGF